MFKNRIEEIFPFLYSQFNPTDVVLVESNINSWKKILKRLEVNIHYTYVDMGYKNDQVPDNWIAYNTKLWHKKEDIKYNILTNTLLNGTIPLNKLKSNWKNISIVNTKNILTENINDFFK